MYIVSQLLVNALFFVNGYIFQSLRRPADELSQGINPDDYVSSSGRRTHALPGSLSFDEVGIFGGSGGILDTHNFDHESVAHQFLFQHSPWHARLLRAAGSGTADLAYSYPGGLPTGYYAGAYVILQALVALSTWIRLLYYFKGILRLGTLVHTMQRIVMDIYPLLALVLVLFIAFWSSIWMLVNVELVSDYNVDWKSPWKSMVKMLNVRFCARRPGQKRAITNKCLRLICCVACLWQMGLYTDIDSSLQYHTRDVLLMALYEIYMFMVQIILLNMLIALMAESNDRVRSIAKLVAQFERAKLILQWERRLSSMPNSTSRIGACIRFFSGFPAARGKKAASKIFPKWLHVLMPADHHAGGLSTGLSGDALAEEALKVARTSLQKGQESHQKLSHALATNSEEVKRLATLLVDTQEKHGNVLRDLARDMAHLRGNGEGVGAIFSRGRGLLASRSPSTTPTEVDVSESQSEKGDQSTKQNWLAGLFGDKKPDEPPASARAALSVAAEEKAAAARPVENKKQAVMKVPSVVPLKLAATGAKRLQMKLPDPLPRVKPSTSAPSKIINEMLAMCEPGSLERARQIASRIRDPSYTLREYYGDIQVAFPELRLYFVESPAELNAKRRATKNQAAGMTSGSDGETEFLRTVGAFFAVYWLMRIGIDGERGFSFGVDDETWQPLTMEQMNNSGSADSKAQERWKNMDPQAVFFAMNPSQRAIAFYQNTRWDRLLGLMVEAGLIERESAVAGHRPACGMAAQFKQQQKKSTIPGESSAAAVDATYRVVQDRVVGILALTAIHDIMKIDVLLPTVQPQHATYAGFAKGDRINDHDVALGCMRRTPSKLIPPCVPLLLLVCDPKPDSRSTHDRPQTCSSTTPTAYLHLPVFRRRCSALSALHRSSSTSTTDGA